MTAKLLSPHAHEPLRIMGSAPPSGAASMRVEEFLAEPPPGHAWGAAVVRRLIGMSTGPVAVAVTGEGARTRLEQAGLFNAAPDHEIHHAQRACWPSLPTLRRLAGGYGSPRPTVVMVTDKTYRPGQLPLASVHGIHLWAALRLLGYDELCCYVTSACDHKRKRFPKRLKTLEDVLGAGDPTWIPLGRQAEKALKQAKVHAIDYVPAPQHHLRTFPEQGVPGYAKLLHAAGLSFGPYHGFEGPFAFSCDTLADLEPPYDLVDVATRRGKKKRGGGRVEGDYNDVPGIQAARRAYVLGEARTVNDAADMVGIDRATMRTIAGKEGWVSERDQHHRALTERAKDEAARAEVKAQASCRKLAWVANQRMLTKLVKRLQDPDSTYLPGARDVEAMTRVALQLSGAGVGSTDAERDALSRMPLADLARQTLDRISKGLGGE